MLAKLVTAPSLEPITLTELKVHLRIELDFLDEDESLVSLIEVSRRKIEQETRRALLTQTWDYFLEDWPEKDFIRLPFGNLQSVPATQSVKWKNWEGTEATLTPTTDYLWETNGEDFGRVVLPYGGAWPTDELYTSNPITVRFVCGWTSQETVPADIRRAAKMICAKLHEGRGEDILAVTVHQDNTKDWLLENYILRGDF